MMQPVDYDTPDAQHERLYNFSAGPGTLPEAVLREAQDEMLVFDGAGASVMEISHRSPEYTRVHESARTLVRKLLGLGDDWHVLFLQGGASMQFHQVPLNFLPHGGSADYLVTGAWSKKALKEAKIVAETRDASARSAATSEDRAFAYVPAPSEWSLRDDAAYVHYTSNNTIFGTQYREEPDAPAPLVCDMSSDFMSRPVNVDRYGLIYAGAQKNVGPAGVTVVLVRDAFLGTRVDGLPTMLDYATHAAKLFNTPPVFAVYLVEKVLRWLDAQGGVEAIEEVNDRKAKRLYDRIDRTDFYRGTVDPAARSRMNVTFRLADASLEGPFIEEAKAAGLLALKGHRSVGGIRASIYNACPPEAVDALVGFVDEFEARRG